jgi:hypothetical protein
MEVTIDTSTAATSKANPLMNWHYPFRHQHNPPRPPGKRPKSALALVAHQNNAIGRRKQAARGISGDLNLAGAVKRGDSQIASVDVEEEPSVKSTDRAGVGLRALRALPATNALPLSGASVLGIGLASTCSRDRPYGAFAPSATFSAPKLR